MRLVLGRLRHAVAQAPGFLSGNILEPRFEGKALRCRFRAERGGLLVGNVNLHGRHG